LYAKGQGEPYQSTKSGNYEDADNKYAFGLKQTHKALPGRVCRMTHAFNLGGKIAVDSLRAKWVGCLLQMLTRIRQNCSEKAVKPTFA
jgi:hypothetical protein